MKTKPPTSRVDPLQDLPYSAMLLAGAFPFFLRIVLATTLLCAGGCDTPYTARVRQLDETYQRGDLSREDYMRFVHDAENWEKK